MGNGQDKIFGDFGRVMSGSILGLGKGIKDGFGTVTSTLKGIPIIGDIVNAGLNIPLPEIGVSLNDLGKMGDMALDGLGALDNEIGGINAFDFNPPKKKSYGSTQMAQPRRGLQDFGAPLARIKR